LELQFGKFDRQLNTNSRAMGYLDGIIYTNQWASPTIFRYNEEGEVLAPVDAECPWVLDFGTSKREGWLFVYDFRSRNIYVLDVENDYQRIGTINGEQIHRQRNQDGGLLQSICWVDDHPDGQLWIGTIGIVYQFFVDIANWEAELVQRILIQADGDGCALGHDGDNIWSANSVRNGQVNVYDDGIDEEIILISYNPAEGLLQAGDEVDISVTIDASRSIEGEYEADLHFQSDDPETPDVVVSILLNVTRSPILFVRWSQEIGFPNEINWNDEFHDLFGGNQYNIIAELTNAGTEILVVENVFSDNEVFTIDFEDRVEIPPRETIESTITFNPPDNEPEVYNGNFVIESNDPDNERIEIPLIGESFPPPHIDVDPTVIRFELVSGAIEEQLINIINTGETVLQGKISVEILDEPDRDNGKRKVRGISNVDRPLRDPIAEGALNGLRFACFTDNSIWGWLDVGMRQDPLLNEDNFISFREENAFDDFVFEDYDALVINLYEQGFMNSYNANLERLTEYVHAGGGIYFETGSPSGNNLPGEITNDQDIRGPNGEFLVSPDPNDQNYSRFAEILHGSEPRFWLEGEIIEGRPFWLISTYSHGQFENGIENRAIDWFQPIASIENVPGLWGAVTYGIGSGKVLTVGTRVGECWFNRNRNGGEWGSVAAEILYYLSSGTLNWITVDPIRFELGGGVNTEIIVTINAEDLIDGDYLASILIESNDPGTPEVEVNISVMVGVPDAVHFILPFEVEDAPDPRHILNVEELTWDNEVPPNEWEIGVFTEGLVLGGSVVWQTEEPVDFFVFGSDEQFEGFENGDNFNFLIWDNEADEEHEVEASFINGPEIWEDGGETTLELSGEDIKNLVLELDPLWNMISINVDPDLFYDENDDRGPSVPLMFEQLEDEEGNQLVEMLKDRDGNFWAPEFGFNNIDFWNITQGYQIKLSEAADVIIPGRCIAPNSDIPIRPNWSIVAYYPEYDLDASAPDFYVLSPIIDFVTIAKDGEGSFMSPQFNFSNMPAWTEGQGYQINIDVEQGIVFNYPPEQEEIEWLENGVSNESVTFMTGSSHNMSVLVNSISGIDLSCGDRISVHSSSGMKIGSGEFTGDQCGLAVWGDEEGTEVVEGAFLGEVFTLKFWDAEKEDESDLEVISIHGGRELEFKSNGFLVIDVEVQTIIPEEYYLSQNYPNPFNSITNIIYGSPEISNISVDIFDMHGRLVKELVNGIVAAGNHNTTWDASNASAGIYFVKMEVSTGFKSVVKVILIN